ncbi:MAG: kinase/pyrophosphorylase, partial [Streptococcus mitis]|nr:kinase/pyrophosphorylase [Streptococcus mitis]
KVCNIPILLNTKLPDELFEIDKNKLFGLTIDKNILKSFREERLKSLNLFGKSQYSDLRNIQKELDHAKEIMDDLGCVIIDVTNRSIEETADIIINHINSRKGEKND